MKIQPEELAYELLELKGEAKILIPGARVFEQAKSGDAGYDIWSITSGLIKPGTSEVFRTGIATAYTILWVGLVLDRSGIGWKGIMRQAGVIDSNWRGEWNIRLYNTSTQDFMVESVLENPKAKACAQVVFVPCGHGPFKVVDELPQSVRNDSWLGSSDKK